MSAREDAAAALARYDQWRDSLYGGTTQTEDMLSTALRALIESGPCCAPPAGTDACLDCPTTNGEPA